MDLQKLIIDAMARTLFVDAYAQHCENGEYNDGNGGPCEGCKLWGHKAGHPQPGGGENWEDFAPKTPRVARDEALKLVGRIEYANRIALVCLLAQAAKADGMDPYQDDFEYPAGYADRFGSDLAMQALGHGVSWFDNHARFDLEVPSIEFNPYL